MGDIVHLSDGTVGRIGELWPDSAQISPSVSSYFLRIDGTASHSGSFLRTIARGDLTASEATAPATFWIFHHNQRRAGNGVEVQIDVATWTAR